MTLQLDILEMYNDIDMFIIFLHCGIVKVPV